jgi:hypothetical protein
MRHPVEWPALTESSGRSRGPTDLILEETECAPFFSHDHSGPYIVIADSFVVLRGFYAAEVSCWRVALLAASSAGITDVPSVVRR